MSLLPSQQLEIDLQIPTEALDPAFVNDDNIEDLMPVFRFVWFSGYRFGRADTMAKFERSLGAAAD